MALFDSDIPPWLVPKKSPADYFAQGSEIGSQISGNILRARGLQMQQEETTAQVGNIMANTELKRMQLQEANRENQAWLNDDAKTIPKWMAATPDERATLPTPEPKSQRGQQIVESVRTKDELGKYRSDLTDVRKSQAAVQLERAQLDTERAQHLSERVASWDAAISTLDDTTYAQIQNLPGKGRLDNGMPTQDTIRIVNLRRAAEGKPPIGAEMKPGKDTSLEPQSKVLDDGTQVVWMPGGTTLHVIKDGKKVELTPSQAAKIATDTEDPDTKDFFQQYAVEKGKSMTGGFTPKKKPEAPKTKSLVDRIKSWFTGDEKAPASAPKVFTDKSGKQFRYTGSASDPMTDKDPAHWELAP